VRSNFKKKHQLLQWDMASYNWSGGGTIVYKNNERYLQGLMYNYWDYGHIVKFTMSNFYIPVSQFPYLMSQCK
jgi:hypothetical protein